MNLFNKTKSRTIHLIISVGMQQYTDATSCPMTPVRSLFSAFSKYSPNSWLLNQPENSPQKGNFSSQDRQQFQFFSCTMRNLQFKDCSFYSTAERRNFSMYQDSFQSQQLQFQLKMPTVTSVLGPHLSMQNISHDK